jgi:secreted trypsin-like serine protease
MLGCSKILIFYLASFSLASGSGIPALFLSDDEGVSTRIVGGTDATPYEFPFFVQWRGCGASLIHEDIILTAAHVRSTLIKIWAVIKKDPQSNSFLFH